LLCDAFEALIGALYLHGRIKAVDNFMIPLLLEDVYEIVQSHIDEDTKSRLQEWAQSIGFPSPCYVLIDEVGPDHEKTFKMEVRIGSEPYGRGLGSSKQTAEKVAAREALKKIGILENQQ
jgi:ribonuclease-3